MLMENWCDQNVSATISYSVEEVPEIVSWLLENWDYYVGVSFLFRADPTKTAEDLGYRYLPQQVVTQAEYEAYVANLQPIDLEKANTLEEMEQEACATGSCPIR
jgi:ribonucleoside-triphosphate reductase